MQDAAAFGHRSTCWKWTTQQGCSAAYCFSWSGGGGWGVVAVLPCKLLLLHVIQTGSSVPPRMLEALSACVCAGLQCSRPSPCFLRIVDSPVKCDGRSVSSGRRWRTSLCRRESKLPVSEPLKASHSHRVFYIFRLLYLFVELNFCLHRAGNEESFQLGAQCLKAPATLVCIDF